MRSQGVDSEIDQYEEAPPEGWPKWMARQIQESDYVLVVCADLLFKRANDHSGDESGLGVKWEKKINFTEAIHSRPRVSNGVFQGSWHSF